MAVVWHTVPEFYLAWQVFDAFWKKDEESAAVESLTIHKQRAT
jgi:hypothetical protein